MLDVFSLLICERAALTNVAKPHLKVRRFIAQLLSSCAASPYGGSDGLSWTPAHGSGLCEHTAARAVAAGGGATSAESLGHRACRRPALQRCLGDT